MSAFSHLRELRARLLKSLGVWLLFFIPGLYYSETLYHWVATPILKLLPPGHHLVVTQVTSSFTVPLRLTWILSLIALMPFFLYQIWHFVAPALYRHEKKWLKTTLFCSILLFYMGASFAFWVVCPMALKFFISITPKDVFVMADLQTYLDFVLSLVFAFGLAFQVPIITWVLLRWGWVTPEQLKASRPYVIVGAFTLGMLLTPPDVLSQILLALPLWGLFELGLWGYSMTRSHL